MEDNQKEIKVTHLTTLDLSGAGRAAYRIVSSERMLACKATLLCLFVRIPNQEYVVAYQVPRTSIYHRGLKRLGLWLPKYKRIENRLKQYNVVDGVSVLQSDCEVHKDILVKQADIIHLHWIKDFVDLESFLDKTKMPIVWTLHDQGAFTGLCNYASECFSYEAKCGACRAIDSTDINDYAAELWEEKKKLFRKHVHRMHFVTPSKWLESCVRKSALMGHLPVTTIPNPIDTDIFKPIYKGQINKIRLLFGAVNAADPYKGYKRLVSVLWKLYDCQMLDADKVEVLILGNNKGISENFPYPVKYLGFVDSDEKLVEIYNSSTILLYASYRDNLPNMIMESMSCGTPVVAYNVGGISDLIDDRINGCLVDTEEEFVAAVVWTLQNRSELSIAARTKVEETYSYEKIAAAYMELYNSIREK